MADSIDVARVSAGGSAVPGRLAHCPIDFGEPGAALSASSGALSAGAGTLSPGHAACEITGRRTPALVLTAEGPRRADLLAWAMVHRDKLTRLRLLAPAGLGALLSAHAGLATEALRAGTVGPTGTAGLAAAGSFAGMIAFSDPIELRPGDTTTRSFTRLAVFWDIPIAVNRATADLLLGQLLAAAGEAVPADVAAAVPAPDGGTPPARGAVQLWTVRATVEDVPGRLAILAASLARRGINILSVQVHLTPDGPVDELLVAASSVLAMNDLLAAVTDGGARAPRIIAADAHALVDAPTRALLLASRVIRNAEDLPAVLTSLLPGADLRWRPDPPEGPRDDAVALWLDDPCGGGFLLTRPATPFTPAEAARARAMVAVATIASTQPARPDTDPEAG